MSLFQTSVIKKYLSDLSPGLIDKKYNEFQSYFGNAQIQENIRNLKEEEYQSEFIRNLFVNILEYTLNPEPNYNIVLEKKNVDDSKKADGAIIRDNEVIAVIELKSTQTTNLDSFRDQAFGYKNHNPKCVYIVTSNFEKIRLYIHDTIYHEEFNLFNLSKERFALLWLCFSKDNILKDIPLKIKEASVLQEENVTKKLYNDYSKFREEIFNDIVKNNPEFDKLVLFKKTQKLLDRFLFIFFAEDRLLLPPNSISEIVKQWKTLKDDLDEYVPLYDRFKKYFGYLNTGYKGKKYDIFPYNGGLFAPDEILDNIKINDEILHKHTLQLSTYDFETDVDVNILGHIFEHSLGEIENVQAEIEGKEVETQKTKRKKDGIFYTPKYITKYIVENTVGKLCEEKRTELEIIDEEFAKGRKNRKKEIVKELDNKLTEYREWLLNITILDPACGSGAFLNQALEFLIEEHKRIDELKAQLLGGSIVFSDIEAKILEKNIYGVDLNEESVEIAKLSLWLRTAQKGRKLTTLSNHIKCGNSLIDDPEIVGEKAFNWGKEFPEVYSNGKFDVVIGNPPYGAELGSAQVEYFRKNYYTVIGHSEIYYLFIEQSIKQLVKPNGMLGFIIPNAWLSNKYASKVRELLINETEINYLINFNRKIIFEDANVETSIFIIRNAFPTSEKETLVGQDIGSEYIYNQFEWKNNQNFLMSFAPNKHINLIIQKLNSSDAKLSDKLDISNGIKPYQVGYGINNDGLPLTPDDVKNKIYHSKIKKDETYKKELKGKGVHRYLLTWEESYIKWGKWLMSPKDQHYFEQPKILIRQIISNYFYAVLDNNKYYADQSTYICTNYPDRDENLGYYLALINSKLYGFYFRKFYSEEDDLFPKIKVNELKNLPIKTISSDAQNLFFLKTTEMLNYNKVLNEKKLTFINRLKDNLDIEKVSNKLESFYDYDFKNFITELKKQKIVFSLDLQDEWEVYFNSYKAEINQLQFDINKTDKEIDQMVYELYDLTEEEIKIVESNH